MPSGKLMDAARKGALLAGIGAGALLAGTAFAQDAAQTSAPDAQASTSVGDIVVTARRREEKLQDVPVSVTALSGTQLERKNVTSAMDLGKIAPSLVVSPSPRGSNTPYFVIRGQRVIDTTIAIDPVTIVYSNEVPFMRPQGLNGALFDIQSIQVLRGPQGTLFGRNSTGGAVLITTNQPVDHFEGNVSATVGDYNRREVQGAVNLPITDRLSVRLAGSYNKRDGYMRDRFTGYRQNNVNYHGERFSLRWEPVDDLVTSFYYNHFDSRTNGDTAQLIVLGPPTSFTAPSYAQLQANLAANRADPFTYASDLEQKNTALTNDITNVTTYKISPSISIKNIMGYRKIKTFSSFDLDGSEVFVQRYFGYTQVKQFSEEFQLSGTSDNFDWLAGLFYFRESGSDFAIGYQSTTPTTPRPSGIRNVVNQSYSGFASGTYRFGGIEGLSISAGARYTHDDRSGDGYQMVGNACGLKLNNGQFLQPPCLFPEKTSFNEPSWSVSVNYKVNRDLLLYVAHRRGYRSGGVQSRFTTEAAAVPFAPERVNDIEVGVKADFNLGDVKGRLNIDGYYAFYKGLQRQISFVAPSTGTLVTGLFNAASSKVRGIEAEATLIPFKGLELNGSVGYVDPKYDSFVSNGVDISYQPFAFVPRWTATGEVRYTLPFDKATVGTISAAYNMRYQSSYVNIDTPAPIQTIKGWALSDVRVDWDGIAGSNFGASFFVTNLFDKYYNPYSTNSLNSLGFVTAMVGAPRMIAFQGRVRF